LIPRHPQALDLGGQGVEPGGELIADRWRRPADITVGQVVRAIEGPIEIVSCMTDGDGCPQYSRCNLRRPVQKIQASISRLLDTMTLHELASDGLVQVAELASTR